MKKIAGAIVIALFFAIILKWFPFPFVWIFGVGSLAAFFQFRKGKKSWRVVWFNIGSILLVLAVFEMALVAVDHFQWKKKPRITSHQLYDVLMDPDFGYVLNPSAQWRAWKAYDDVKVYDVTYTIGQNGLRVSPPCTGACERSLLFFGGSFMYGEGVNDHETLPYQVGLKSQGQYEVYNFGVHGHGPQFMLALVESGKLRSMVEEPPNFAIYQALYPEHVYRVAGLRNWVRAGPKYMLDADGNALQSGSFADDGVNLPYWQQIKPQVRKSALGRIILDYTRSIDSTDDDLFVAVVRKTDQLLKELNPDIEFHILIWGDPPVEVVSKLEDANITVHRSEDILRANNITDSAARISQDRHPTALAHALFADYFVNRLLKIEGNPK